MRGDSGHFHSTVLYIFDITFSTWCLYSEVVLCCIADKGNYFPGFSIKTLLQWTQCDATERFMKGVGNSCSSLSMIKQFYGTLNVYTHKKFGCINLFWNLCLKAHILQIHLLFNWNTNEWHFFFICDQFYLSQQVCLRTELRCSAIHRFQNLI